MLREEESSVEYDLLIARSVTQAQQMERALRRAGVRAAVFRTPMELTEGRGCTYAVRVGHDNFQRAWQLIITAGLRPVQIFYAGPGGYQEVAF